MAPYGANFFHSGCSGGGSYASALLMISNRFIRTAAGRIVGVLKGLVRLWFEFSGPEDVVQHSRHAVMKVEFFFCLGDFSY